jgi:hypothetical protein
METANAPADNPKCPYCGAANGLDSEFCGACYKKLHIPAEVRAEAGIRKILAAPLRRPLQDAGAGEARPTARLWLRAALIAGLLAFYGLWLGPENHFSKLDLVNLAFHEAGHIFLGFFGRFITVLGGTLFQLLIPAVCLAHLWRRGNRLGWQLCLYWLGENLLNISIYAGDAIRQELPLVGGGVHDWTYLLTETGLIAHPDRVARTLFLAGSAVIFYSVYLIALDAKNREPLELGNLR